MNSPRLPGGRRVFRFLSPSLAIRGVGVVLGTSPVELPPIEVADQCVEGLLPAHVKVHWSLWFAEASTTIEIEGEQDDDTSVSPDPPPLLMYCRVDGVPEQALFV